MRIVDDDSGFEFVAVVGVVVAAAADGIGGGLSMGGCWGIFDGGRTTADAGRFNAKCVVFTNGFADADNDGFRPERCRAPLPPPTVLSYRCRYSSVLNFAVACWGLFTDCWSTYWINNSVND